MSIATTADLEIARPRPLLIPLIAAVAMMASHASRPSIALISAAIAVGVELFRLVHAPWLDAFRLTLPGALLLGRIFSPWNMLTYGVGIISRWGSIAARSRPSRFAYAAMLARVETESYQRFNAACSSPIGRPAALVAKSTVTTPVMSATENSSPDINGTSASRALKSA